jgi:hypothetical protein
MRRRRLLWRSTPVDAPALNAMSNGALVFANRGGTRGSRGRVAKAALTLTYGGELDAVPEPKRSTNADRARRDDGLRLLGPVRANFNPSFNETHSVWIEAIDRLRLSPAIAL